MKREIQGAVYLFVRIDRYWQQQAYVKASNSDAGDAFGWVISVSADAKTLAVAAVGERSATTGINGDLTDISVSNSGAVYLY